MKKYFSILVLSGILAAFNSNGNPFQQSPVDLQLNDTVIENRIITEVIEAPTVPKKEKVEYISQLTRYGFKNLFTKFKYNPSMSYASQVHPQAEVYMQEYLQHHSSSLLKMKSWGLAYFNLIDNIFNQYGLPRELKYLAVIESNLQTTATSWVGAAGPWQFMPYTARGMGLVVNSNIDERRDYFKSTHAAARYLLQLYRDLDDWLLVIAAYNGGPGRVYDAIKKSGSRDFWTLQYQLPLESRNHVKKFIATHFVMEANATDLSNGGLQGPLDNKPMLSPEELNKTSSQTISGKYTGAVIAKNLEMDLTAFHRYNPNFDGKLAMNGQFDLVLPTDKMEIFIANKYQILNECVQLMLNDDGSNGVYQTKTVYPTRKSSRKKSKSRG